MSAEITIALGIIIIEIATVWSVVSAEITRLQKYIYDMMEKLDKWMETQEKINLMVAGAIAEKEEVG